MDSEALLVTHKNFYLFVQTLADATAGLFIFTDGVQYPACRRLGLLEVKAFASPDNGLFVDCCMPDMRVRFSVRINDWESFDYYVQAGELVITHYGHLGRKVRTQRFSPLP